MVHDSHDICANEIVEWLRRYNAYFRESGTPKTRVVKSEGNGVVVCKPPNLGVYKLNTDATIDRASECVGFGLVLYDL